MKAQVLSRTRRRLHTCARGGQGRLIANDMFPYNWLEDKIIEEIAFAFNNKKYTGRGNQWLGEMSDGSYCILCINGNANVIDNTTKLKTVWPFIR